MIRTLRAANGASARVGHVQVQSNNDAIASRPVRSLSGSPSAGALQGSQATIRTPVFERGDDGNVNIVNDSLEGITARLVSGRGTLPSYHSEFNTLTPGRSEPTRSATLRPMAARKFEPYERLTGISHDRPEIVMLTNFLPLFNDAERTNVPITDVDARLTDAGAFIDTHLQARHLRHSDATRLVRNLRTNFERVKRELEKRRKDFDRSVDSLSDTSNFLLELVRSNGRIKAQLDLRDDTHIVDPGEVIRNYSMLFSTLGDASNALLGHAVLYLPPTYSIVDALVKLGYASESVKNVFSSTKVWLQLLVELDGIVRSHSLEFIDADHTAQRRDNNPAHITRSSVKRFNINSQLETLPDLGVLSGVNVNQLPSSVSTIRQAWSSLYTNVLFRSDEAHIAGLINVLSKEFRYSKGLSSGDVQRTLTEHFGYAVQPTGNGAAFDHVIGRAGSSIAEIPTRRTNSLANVASSRPAPDTAVLTFESKYVDGDSGTLTPGGSYYVDRVLRGDGSRFDVSGIDELAATFGDAYKNFGVIVEGLNLLVARVDDPYDGTYAKFASILSSPVDLAKHVLHRIVDERTGRAHSRIANDNLGAVYSYAATNDRVKSALFLYTMVKITRTYNPVIPFFHAPLLQGDNTPLADALVSVIVTTLENSVSQSLAGVKLSSERFNRLPLLSVETVKAALKVGTQVSSFVESIMQTVLLAFRRGDEAMIDRRTRFGGHVDTMIMMVAFDMVLRMLARYDDQTIVAVLTGQSTITQGTSTFVVSRTNAEHSTSMNDLITRLEREVALTHQTVYAVLNTSKKLHESLRNYSNYLNSPSSEEKLRTVSRLLNDPSLVRMLMSEQQITLLAATTQDLVDRVSQVGSSITDADVDGDGDFDADDELKVLDDSVVSPRLRDAVFGAFGDPAFTSRKGYNKKLMTIGVPLGFAERLKQRVSTSNLKRTTFVDKQSDIVRIAVYKVDMQNSDIVYLPVRFLFELSRFPVRNDRAYLSVPDSPSFDDVIASIPTRDFGERRSQNGDPHYWPSSPQNAGKLAFDETYAFLTNAEKDEIVRNHVMSYLCEVYIKLLTGIGVGDHNYDVVDRPNEPDVGFVKMVTDHFIERAADSFASSTGQGRSKRSMSGGVLFSTTASPERSSKFSYAVPTKTLEASRTRPLRSNVSTVSHRNASTVLHGLRTISAFSRMLTPMSTVDSVTRRIVSPKQFDRVFNVVIDPDDFEIDYAATTATPHGKQSLEQLIRVGDVVRDDSSRGTTAGFRRASDRSALERSTGRYRFRDRDRTQGDIAFEKYFVSVETYSEDQV